MNLVKLLSNLEESHRKSIDEIVYYLEVGDSTPEYEYEKEFKELARFIATTDLNSYSFMPSGWEGIRGNSEGLSHFLAVLHHAMVDDGEHCLVGDKNKNFHPKLMFIDSSEVDLIREELGRGYSRFTPELELYESVSDFLLAISEYEEYHTEKSKRISERFNK